MGLVLMHLSRFASSINRDDPGQREQNLVFSLLAYVDNRYAHGTLSEAAAALGEPEYALSRVLKSTRAGTSRSSCSSARSSRPPTC